MPKFIHACTIISICNPTLNLKSQTSDFKSKFNAYDLKLERFLFYSYTDIRVEAIPPIISKSFTRSICNNKFTYVMLPQNKTDVVTM